MKGNWFKRHLDEYRLIRGFFWCDGQTYRWYHYVIGGLWLWVRGIPCRFKDHDWIEERTDDEGGFYMECQRCGKSISGRF